jgi:hypothetical protein
MTERHHPPESTGEGNTQDLGIRATGSASAIPAQALEWFDQPHAEQHVRTRGKWMIMSGVVVTLLVTALAVAWDIGRPDEMPLALLLPLQAFGLGAIALGCLEWLNRPSRSMLRRCLTRVDQLEMALVDLVGLMDEDKRQAWYQGYANRAKDERRTGTENSRPVNWDRSGDVIKLRRRNGG